MAMAAPGDVHILLVEDDADSAEALTLVLKKGGYQAQPVGCARDAVARLRDPVRTPDVMVLDLTLPDLSGDALVAAMLAVEPRPPVVLISAAPERALASAARAMGAVAALRKPFGTQALLAAVGEAAAVAGSGARLGAAPGPNR